METELIALDWGITSLRAYRLDEQGGVMDEKNEPVRMENSFRTRCQF